MLDTESVKRCCSLQIIIGPRQANLVLITYASSEGSGEPAHPRSLARTSAARSYKQWVKRNLQTESQIPGPSEWLGMRSWNLSWRNARRHKFAWRGPNNNYQTNVKWNLSLTLTRIRYRTANCFIFLCILPTLTVFGEERNIWKTPR